MASTWDDEDDEARDRRFVALSLGTFLAVMAVLVLVLLTAFD